MPAIAHGLRDRAIRSIDRLPPLSAGAAKLITVLAKREVEVREVLTILEQDPILAPKVLQLANSGAFGRRQTINTIKHAVAFVGASTLRRQVLGWTFQSLFRRLPSTDKLPWSVTQFMMHSQATAMFADVLCDHIPVQNAAGAYVAGLIHDVGKILIATEEPVLMSDVPKLQRLKNISLIESEHELLGVDHCEISALAAEKWRLPKEIREAVLKHHMPDPDKGNPVPLSLVLAKADTFVNSLGLSLTGEAGDIESAMAWPGRELAMTASVKAFETARNLTAGTE